MTVVSPCRVCMCLSWQQTFGRVLNLRVRALEWALGRRLWGDWLHLTLSARAPEKVLDTWQRILHELGAQSKVR